MKLAEMTRNEKKKERTRANIIEAGVNLFSENGFHETKVKDITDSIDVGYGTFYQYFKNKEELLDCIMDDLSNQTVAYISNFSYQGLTIRERMQYAAYDIINFVAENMAIIKAVYAAPMSQGQSRLIVLWEKLYEHINQEYETFYDKGLLNEHIRKEDLIVFFWMMKGIIEGLVESGTAGVDIKSISNICGDMHYYPSFSAEVQARDEEKVKQRGE